MKMEVLMAEKLSDLLREARLEKGYSEEKLGSMMGLSHAAISNYENERLIPSDMQLRSFAEIFGLNLDTLVAMAREERCEKGLRKLKARYSKSFKRVLLRAVAKELNEN